jgi:hypothetical protein
MAQVFHPSTNTLARLSIVGLVGLPVVLILSGMGFSRGSWNTNVGVPMDQPAPFSHEHHAVELGIDCRYCHTAVEKSAHATVPPTQTCFTCHSQIWTNSPLLEPVRASIRDGAPLKWIKLHSVPDFVYFNHSIHINRGINCNVCHGAIQKEMITFKGKPFFMAWCLNCHRNPEEYVGDRKEVFGLYEKYQTDAPLTPEERSLAEGDDYTRTPEEIARGEQRLKAYRVQKKQLADCWICHR